jgi:thiol:disulfide interchange protein
MKRTVLAERDVRETLKGFVVAELYTDRRREGDKENARLMKERFGSVALPLYLVLGPDGKERSRLTGLASTGKFLEFLKAGS